MKDASKHTPPQPDDLPDCVELGVWTKVPLPVPDSLRVRLKDIAPEEAQALKERRVMSFHAVGCTGCHADQRATIQVATAMAGQVAHPLRYGGSAEAVHASFFYHLGDVIYKTDKETVGQLSLPPLTAKDHDFAGMYATQFYGPYAPYPAPIFALAGNHDGKDRDPEKPGHRSAIHQFLKNFCGLDDGEPLDPRVSGRPRVVQPYPYWLLRTPVAYLVGLYTNVCNAGQLDDPLGDTQPQFDWLVQTLTEIATAADDRAVILALHYPPLSAAANFRERGDPNLGPTPRPDKPLEPLNDLLQRAFRLAGRFPDLVLSAHAHLYQRLTCTHADGRQIPYLIAGAGGHTVEKLTAPCAKTGVAAAEARVVFPPGSSLPAGDRVELATFEDQHFGFLRITVDQHQHRLMGEYFTLPAADAPPGALPARSDFFTLDLRTHTVR